MSDSTSSTSGLLKPALIGFVPFLLWAGLTLGSCFISYSNWDNASLLGRESEEAHERRLSEPASSLDDVEQQNQEDAQLLREDERRVRVSQMYSLLFGLGSCAFAALGVVLYRRFRPRTALVVAWLGMLAILGLLLGGAILIIAILVGPGVRG
jgi:hypothetical protein